mmetsp:Transcript_18753/g.24150  ORF Transcript_18753/g.24150 Transcript_18753/m.24150 type:complete len:188 (-) Transcript_18753:135-698(-)
MQIAATSETRVLALLFLVISAQGSMYVSKKGKKENKAVLKFVSRPTEAYIGNGTMIGDMHLWTDTLWTQDDTGTPYEYEYEVGTTRGYCVRTADKYPAYGGPADGGHCSITVDITDDDKGSGLVHKISMLGDVSNLNWLEGGLHELPVVGGTGMYVGAAGVCSIYTKTIFVEGGNNESVFIYAFNLV